MRVPERLALRGERPLQHVNVVVPQAGDQPRAVGAEDFAEGSQDAGRRDVGDDAVGEEHVDRAVRRKQICARRPRPVRR